MQGARCGRASFPGTPSIGGRLLRFSAWAGEKCGLPVPARKPAWGRPLRWIPFAGLPLLMIATVLGSPAARRGIAARSRANAQATAPSFPKEEVTLNLSCTSGQTPALDPVPDFLPDRISVRVACKKKPSGGGKGKGGGGKGNAFSFPPDKIKIHISCYKPKPAPLPTFHFPDFTVVISIGCEEEEKDLPPAQVAGRIVTGSGRRQLQDLAKQSNPIAPHQRPVTPSGRRQLEDLARKAGIAQPRDQLVVTGPDGATIGHVFADPQGETWFAPGKDTWQRLDAWIGQVGASDLAWVVSQVPARIRPDGSVDLNGHTIGRVDALSPLIAKLARKPETRVGHGTAGARPDRGSAGGAVTLTLAPVAAGPGDSWAYTPSTLAIPQDPLVQEQIADSQDGVVVDCTGNSAGQICQKPGWPIPDSGSQLIPGAPSGQRMYALAAHSPVHGFCMDRGLAPPQPGRQYYRPLAWDSGFLPEGNPFLYQLLLFKGIDKQIKDLVDAGAFSDIPMDPKRLHLTLSQLYLWHLMDHLNFEMVKEHVVAQVKDARLKVKRRDIAAMARSLYKAVFAIEQKLAETHPEWSGLRVQGTRAR